MTQPDKVAVLYRMILPDHECPFGIRARQLLEDAGYEIEEHILASRDEVEAFMEREGVEKTPQVYIGGKRVGGSGSLARHLESEGAA